MSNGTFLSGEQFKEPSHLFNYINKNLWIKEEVPNEVRFLIEDVNLRKAAWLSSAFYELVDNGLPIGVEVTEVRKGKSSVILVVAVWFIGAVGSYYLSEWLRRNHAYDKTAKLSEKLFKRFKKYNTKWSIGHNAKKRTYT